MSPVKQQQPPTRVCAVATRMDGREGGREDVRLLWAFVKSYFFLFLV